MTITRGAKRQAQQPAEARPQRRRSGLKAAVAAAGAARPGRRALGAGRAAAAGPVAAAQPSNVRVVVRVRPENEREKQGGFRLVVQPLDDHMLIFDPRQQSEDFYFQGVRQRQRDLNRRASRDVQYMFDRVFHPHHCNQQVFEATTKDVIDTVIDGFNCSVFAYGSTGAGKTHTMLGTAAEPGIIFLTVMELYSRITAMTQTKCQVAVSYVEVYNETVTDLLEPSGPLDVREDGQRAVVITGLSQATPDGPDHLMTILEAGNRNRTQHPTDMNAESSRSHAVFQVLLRQSDSTAALSTDVRLSKLSLIDLAGSERGSATGHKGARFREGANINRSLLALGSCINALADGKKFVPYRDSKLTRLLKDSIGGNCKTVMIANVTPSAASFEDTHNTLKYADRAKAIKTRLQRNVVSVDMHVAQYAKIVDELRQEVAELKSQLAERPSRPSTPTPAEPPLDSAPLRAAEAARRALVTRQLQLEAESQQLRLRLHRRRLCAQRAALLRPGGAARPDRQRDRLAGRLSQAHARLERARGELSEAVQAAEREAERVPPGQARDQLMELLEKERQLDECRVHAAHLEAFSRLLQLELAGSDHLLGQLIAAFREQYRLLGYMNFVTPELEAQYKEIVGLVEGQKEVCWADQQQPAADSPGQPSYDVTALLRLADTTYRPAEPARHAIGGALHPPAPRTRAASVPAPAPVTTPVPATVPAAAPALEIVKSDSSGPESVASTPPPPLPPPAMTPGGDLTPPSLAAELPPSETTLGCGADDEVLIAASASSASLSFVSASSAVGAAGEGEETPCRPRARRPGSPVFYDAEPGPETPRPAGRAEETAGGSEEEVSPGPVQADRELEEAAVSVPSPREVGAGTLTVSAPPAGEEQEPDTTELSYHSAAPVAAVLDDGATGGPETSRRLVSPPPPPSTGSPGSETSLSPTPAGPDGVTPPRGPDPAELDAAPTEMAALGDSPDTGLGSLGTVPDGGRQSGSPNLNATVTMSPDGSGLASPYLNAALSVTAPDLGESASPDRNATATMSTSHVGKSASPDLNATVTMPASHDGKSASPDLNATVTMPASHIRKPSVSPNLNATVTMPTHVVKSESPNLNTTVTVPKPQAKKSPSPDQSSALTVPKSRAKKSPSPDQNPTVTAPKSLKKSPSPGLNTTVTVPPPQRRRSPAVPAACRPPVDLNATRTLSPAAPLSSAGLPSFDSSPIRPHPVTAALCVPLPPDLPPTPEILRRTRTPLKSRHAPSAATAAAAGMSAMDSTFTMPPPFRGAPESGGGGGAAAGGGGQRTLAGKTAVRGGGAENGARHGTGLSRSASAAHVSQAARGGRPAPAPAAAPARRGLAATAPAPGRLSLSAQKAKSTSRLHTSAPGGRDENQMPERPAWGRTAPPPSSAAADKAASRSGLISAVGKFGLGRNRTGGHGLTKSRSEAVLRPANR